MSTLLDQFRAEHDPGKDYQFDGIVFRPGARFSLGPAGQPLSFGLSEGFRQLPRALEWGWVRIHTGEDRAGGRDGDAVYNPFDATRSCLHMDDQTYRVYGSLVRLLSDRWGFEVRVAHMDPGVDIDPVALPLLCENKPIPAGARLGVAGQLGLGAGRHTHTEIVSLGATAPLLDEILLLKYGEDAEKEYTREQIMAEYQRYAKTSGMGWNAVEQDYEALRKLRGITWCNRLKHVYRDPYSRGAPRTRYSTRYLFGM